MGEPITIYKGKEETTVHGQGQLDAMVANGWSVTKPAQKPAAKKATKRGK